MSVDPAFGLDNFKKSKLYSESETLANNILAVLFAKPGSFPSMPKLGMYIQGVVMRFTDEIDTEAIKSELVVNCSHFENVVSSGEFDVQKRTVTNKEGTSVPILVLIIPAKIKNVSNQLLIGIVYDGGKIRYNFNWLD